MASPIWSIAASPAGRPHLSWHPVRRAGFFYPATVLTNVAPDAPVSTEEIFGPSPRHRSRFRRRALALANSSEYGLVGYVYSRDLAHGLRHLRTARVAWSFEPRLVSDPAAPFGGIKESGLAARAARGHRRIPRDQVRRRELVDGRYGHPVA